MKRKKKLSKKIYVSVFSSLERICSELDQADIDYVVNTKSTSKRCLLHLYTNVNLLAGGITELKHPPILLTSTVVYNHLRFFNPCLPLDFKLMFKGFVIRTELKLDKLRHACNVKFSSSGDLPFVGKTKGSNIRTEFTRLLFAYMKTIPVTIRDPFMVALASSIESLDYRGLDTFITNNRLVTNINAPKLKAFIEHLTQMQTAISSMFAMNRADLLASFNQNELAELDKVEFIVSNFGTKELQSYLDHENTVNFRY